MRKELEEELKIWTENIRAFHLPRWRELPEIELYMDQVLNYVERVLGVFSDGESKLVTSSMINNYVKQELIRAPENKKYDKYSLAAIFIICLFKRILSINEIDELIRTRKGDRDEGRDAVYDAFAADLENALRAFIPPDAERMRATTARIDGVDPYAVTLIAFVNHVYAKKLIELERKNKILEGEWVRPRKEKESRKEKEKK